jgi:hypothetical protein
MNKSSLVKILVVVPTMYFLTYVVLSLIISFIRFISLFISDVFLFLLGFYFVLNDLIYFIEWNIITLNSGRIVMTFLFHSVHA